MTWIDHHFHRSWAKKKEISNYFMCISIKILWSKRNHFRISFDKILSFFLQLTNEICSWRFPTSIIPLWCVLSRVFDWPSSFASCVYSQAIACTWFFFCWHKVEKNDWKSCANCEAKEERKREEKGEGERKIGREVESERRDRARGSKKKKCC